MKTLKEGTVLTDVQWVEWASKAIDDEDEEGLMLMIKKKLKMLKKWIWYAVEEYSKAEDRMIA